MIPDSSESFFKINPQGRDQWAMAVGRLMLNFGAIQLLSLGWVAMLCKDTVVNDLASEMRLAGRLDLIELLIERTDLSKECKRNAISKWQEVRKLSELRNEVAHNPVILGWHGPERPGAPDYIGIPNFKLKRRKRASPKPLIELKALNLAVDRLAALARALEVEIDQFHDLDTQK